MLKIQHILIPTDFSAPSLAAFQVAAALARDYRARLLVMHVRENPVAPFVPFGEGQPSDDADHQRLLMDQLGKLRTNDGTVGTEYVLVEGAPAEEILRVALARHCDLIVMGTRGRSGLGKLLMGSVTDAVMQKAPCPVLTIKHPMPAAEAGKKE